MACRGSRRQGKLGSLFECCQDLDEDQMSHADVG